MNITGTWLFIQAISWMKILCFILSNRFHHVDSIFQISMMFFMFRYGILMLSVLHYVAIADSVLRFSARDLQHPSPFAPPPTDDRPSPFHRHTFLVMEAMVCVLLWLLASTDDQNHFWQNALHSAYSRFNMFRHAVYIFLKLWRIIYRPKRVITSLGIVRPISNR